MRRWFWILIALFTVFVAAASVVAANLKNNLANNEHWRVSKREFQEPNIGGNEFHRERQSLSGNALHLGVWGEFQEVLYFEQVTLKSLAFKFLMRPDGYLCVVFDKSSEGFAGVVVSANPLQGSALVRGDAGGGFIERNSLSFPALRPDGWN